MREPTPEERSKERSFFYSNAADFGTNALLIMAAIASGSLTMLSEAIRSMLMLCASLYAFGVLRAVHRGRLTRFEYGLGKLEQMVWVVVGLALTLSGLWVGQKIFAALFETGAPASPFGLTAAALVNAVNTLINFLSWYAMFVASGAREDGVYGAQLRARFTMMTSSFFLQITLTIAALAKDNAFALILDALGATFVSGLMLSNGVRMIARALPDLLDAPAHGAVVTAIRTALVETMPEDDVVAIRTRRSGRVTFAEVTVREPALPSVAALQGVRASIRDALQSRGDEVEIALVPASGPASSEPGVQA